MFLEEKQGNPEQNRHFLSLNNLLRSCNMDTEYINEDDLQAFQEALDYDPIYAQSAKSEVDLTQGLVGSNELGGQIRPVDKITSKNDWGPIRRRLNNHNNKQKGKDDYFQSYSYKILRYPILIPILAWCSVLMLIYFFLRIYISLYEYFFTWTGKKRKLRKKLRESKDYKEWISNALKLDEYLKFDKWKSAIHFYYYDYNLLKITVKKLKSLRTEDTKEQLLLLLQSCIKANFAGTENPILYARTYYGTKRLVEEYNTEVVESLNYILEDAQLSIEIKKNFFKSINKNFGKTALALSGGACFAYNHFGVVKALVDNDLLPTIISGTSGGGIVAALATTRSNEELQPLLVPELAKKITACNEPFSVYSKRFIKTGARFDSVDWARKCMWFTMGSMTFKEAYERTGKILNISTVPADPHSPVILCNHITSPNCVIWSTLLASAAVPGILNPVVLMMKDPKTGELSPFSLGTKYKDGSLRTDIPVEALNTYFNVKFSIVSQTNPHISLFFFAPKGSIGRPVSRSKTGLRGGFIGAGLENFIKLENKKWLKLIKSLDLLPHLMDQDWSNVWLQKFSGTVTIWPKIKLKDFWYILSDPDEDQMTTLIRNGEISTFPKLLFIKHRLNIERTIEAGLQKYKKEARNSTAKTDSQIGSDLEDDKGNIYRPLDYDLDSGVDGLQYQVRFGDSLDDEDEDDPDYAKSEADESMSEREDNESGEISEDEGLRQRRRSAWW